MKIGKKVAFLLFYGVCLLFAVALVACGGSEDGGNGGAQAELRPAQGGKQYGGIYRMNHTESIKTLDPVGLNDAPSHHVIHQIGEMLVDFDDDLHLQPELAERWEVSEDGLTYTYHIRQGVRFHDSPAFADGKGRLLTAHDVKFCFDRILDVRSGSKGADYFRDKVVGGNEFYKATGNDPSDEVMKAGVKGFRVIDDSTFAIDLVKPFAAFKYYPALGMGYIYPREAVDKYGKDFFRNFVGTGPFVLDKWEQDQYINVKRNPNYWRKDEHGNQLPFLDGIRFTMLPTEEQQLNEFKAGNLEESYRIPSEFIPTVFTDVKAGANGKPILTPEYGNFDIHSIPALSTQFYGMLTTVEPFKDKRVRQAFNHAIDRERIIAFVLKGQAAGPAIHGLVPPSMPGYPAAEIKGYTFDREKAKALLAEAGYPDGKGFPEVTLQLNSGGGRNAEIAEAIQEMLNTNLGIRVQLQTVEWSQHIDLIDMGKAPFYRLGWIADYPDPETFLNLLYGKNAAPMGQISPLNSTRYNNPALDAIFEQAISVQDDAQRMQLYAQAEQLAVDDAPMLWIFHDIDFRLVQPYVKGYTSNPMDRRDLTRAWFDYGASGRNAGEEA